MSTRPDVAVDAWRSMRALVLDLHDRRAAVSEAIGMSYLRAKALRLLVPGPMLMRDLCGALTTDASSPTVMADDREARGLVAREVTPADRRSRLVRITDAGREVAHRADAIQVAPPAALGALTDEEV